MTFKILVIGLLLLLVATGVSSAFTIYIDAEDGKPTPPLQVKTDKPDAFGKKYIVAPNGVGNDGNGLANYDFVAPKDGKYYFWGRAIAANGDDDSYYWSIDNPAPRSAENCGAPMPGPQAHIWDTGNPILNWQWSRLNSRNCAGAAGQQQVVVELKKGKHTLNMIQREDGTELDGLVIADIPNPTLPQTEAEAAKLKKGLPVEPKGKLAGFWGAIKAQH